MSLQESQMGSMSPLDAASTEGEKKVEGRTPTQLAIRRFRKDRLSMIAFVIVVVYLICAILAPLLVKAGVLDPFKFNQNLLDANQAGVPKGAWGGVSWSHPLGVEPGTGRDVLARLWYGVTFSLAIALSATIIASVIGIVLGIVAGVTGGWTDSVIGRIIDLTLSFPQTLMLLALSGPAIAWLHRAGAPQGNFTNGLYVALVLAIFGWPSIARLIRGQVLSIREREFVEASRLFGASRARLYFREILPNLWAPILVSFTLTMPSYISAEAALSYLGVGVSGDTPTLGNVLRASINYSYSDFFFFFAPAFLIMVIVVSFNLFGDGLRDALDPKADR